MQRKYSSKFKKEIVLTLLKEEKTVEEVASEYNLSPGMVRNWRLYFLNNCESVFDDKSKKEKEIKKKEDALERKNEKMLKTIGQLTIERDFLQDCFRRSGYPVPAYDQKE